VQMRNVAEAEDGMAPVFCFWLGLDTDSSNAVAPVNDLAADAVSCWRLTSFGCASRLGCSCLRPAFLYASDFLGRSLS
jgi:hypothetical protein